MAKEFGTQPVLEVGSGGIFDVFANGQLVYSKFETRRFPAHDLVVDRIRELQG